MKRRLLCLLLALTLLLLPACSGDLPQETAESTPTGEVSDQRGQFTLPIYESATLHPVLGKNKTNATLATLLYEGLFALDETCTPQMVLCQSYTESNDGLTWRFTLRSGVTWSDGTSLRAEEVAAALNTARGSESRYAGRLSGVSGVTAEGERTVVVTLSSPNGYLPALLDIPIAKDRGERPAGTGPYRLVDGEAGLVLALRSDWWQRGEKNLKADYIALMKVSAADDLLYAFDTRDVDLVVTDFTGSETLGYSSDYAVWEFDTANLIYLGFRTAGDSPCANPALRAAISKAIDREALVNGVFAHHGKAAALPVSPASPLYDAELAATTGDGGQALRTLEGQKSEPLTLVVCNENTFKVSAAAAIAETLRAAGLTVEVERLSFEEYTAALQGGRFDLYLAEVTMTPDFDATALVGTGGRLNYGRYSDEATDRLLQAFRRADETGRTDAARTLYRDLLEKTPIAPLCFKTGSVLTQWGRISGLTPTAADPFYRLENWTF